MRKAVAPFMVFPILLVIVGSVFAFINTSSSGIALEGSSLLESENEMFIFGSLLSPLFFFMLASIVGMSLVTSLHTTTKNIGVALYSTSFISSLLMSISMRTRYIDGLEDDTFTLGIGGYLLFVGSILGLIFVLFLTLGPIIADVTNDYYNGNKSNGNNKIREDKGIFASLKQWKALLDKEVLSPKEYISLKEETLSKFNPKRNNAFETITELKNAMNEDLISEEDFIKFKSQIINSSK